MSAEVVGGGAATRRPPLGAKQALAVAAWFEWRTLAAFARNTRRHPARFMAWLVWAVVFVLAIAGRALSTGVGAIGGQKPAGIVAALAPGGVLVAIGLRGLSATRRAPLRFSQPADGHFLPSSALSPAMVLSWLACRRMAAVTLRMLPAVGFVVLVYASGLAAGALGVLCVVVGIALTGMLVYVVAIPAWLLARRRRSGLAWVRATCLAATAAGLALVALAVARAVQLSGHLGPAFPRAFLARLATVRVGVPPGSWLSAALAGHAIDLPWLAGLVALLVACTGALASDCYPEMWEASVLSFRIRALQKSARPSGGEIRQLRKAARTGARDRARRPAADIGAPALARAAAPAPAPAPARAAAPAPAPLAEAPEAAGPRDRVETTRAVVGREEIATVGKRGAAAQVASQRGPGRWRLVGAWSLAWKEWAVVGRQGGRVKYGGAAVLAVLVGAAAGLYAASSAQPGKTLAPLGGALAYVSLVGGVSASQRIGADLAQPLWWLSAASVRNRLAMANACSALRLGIPISLGVLVALATAGLPFVAVGLVPAVLGLLWAVRAVGTVVFVLMPHRADLRGPGGMARLLGTLALGLPLGVAGGIVGGLSGSPTAAFGAVAASAAGTGWLLVSLAGRRLRGNGMGTARSAQQLG